MSSSADESWARLTAGYAPTPFRYDEMLDEARRPRPHWRALLSHLSALPPGALREAGRAVNASIAADGVTYNVHADPKGGSRPWELDPLPLVLPAEEWGRISAAVAQRARLLDAVLKDLYGPQTLLEEGLVPPALVFGQRGFLWPAHGVEPPGGVFLHVYAADLARGPDGRWWVLGDRTGGPTGAGYALQNRLTLARAFPDALRELHVEPIAPFFAALEETLYRLAPTGGEAPLAVWLTPGPFDESYFEHSFLARHLGLPLVEGQDLIVRGSGLYLKTLRGLRRVHAVLRRLDDDLCDPVELRADSALGVPGLLHAVRAGNVLVANALGSSVLETGALAGFYPAVSRRLLGEELAMPSIATWWCGEAPALEHATAHLGELVVKAAYPSIRREPAFGHALDAAGRARLEDRMRGQPHAYLAQEWFRLAHAPTWDAEQGRLVPRAATLRVFAVASPSGYVVMPGGLTRVARQDGDVVSVRWGGSSKDTWALADAPHQRAPFRRRRLGAADVARSGVDLPSRVGENLFWMGRYAERCEGIARLLRAALVRLADAAPEEAPALASLEDAAERLGVFGPRPEPGARGSVSSRPVGAPDFVAAAVDPALPGGLAANVHRLRGAANQVRERMSTDNWHVLSRLPQRLAGPGASLGAALESLDEVMLACVALAGFAMDDMTRDESWHFLALGRRVERLTHLSAILAHVLRLPPEGRASSLEWLLESANSIVTFRARFRRAPELLPVLHLVVFDPTNPHALAFQLRDVARTLGQVADELGGELLGAPLRPLAIALHGADLSGFEPEAGEALEAACAALAELCAACEQAGCALSDEVQRRFFSHAATPAPLGISLR